MTSQDEAGRNLESSGPFPAPESARFLQSLREAIGSNQPNQTVRLICQGRARHLIPPNGHCREWLLEHLGPASTEKIVEAFVHYPCPYCKAGHETCPACDGHGWLPDGAICEGCEGLGLARCDFCDGSGWAEISDVPQGLRRVIVVERAKTALARLQKLLKEPLTRTDGNNRVEGLKHCGRRLLAVDRLMGALENTVVAEQKYETNGSASPKAHADLIQSCVRAASMGEREIRNILATMAALFQEIADDMMEPRQRRIRWESGARFYSDLVHAGAHHWTKTAHPFLDRARSGSRSPTTVVDSTQV